MVFSEGTNVNRGERQVHVGLRIEGRLGQAMGYCPTLYSLPEKGHFQLLGFRVSVIFISKLEPF